MHYHVLHENVHYPIPAFPYNTIISYVPLDRYVLIGNHRDAWGLGSVDPTSGTASLLEITRVFGKMVKEGKTLLRNCTHTLNPIDDISYIF